MTTAEAFKFGFLLKCAELELDSRETKQLIKRASGIIGGIKDALGAPAALGSAVGGAAKGGADLVKGTGDLLWKTLLWSALGGAAAGGAGGYLVANAMDDNVDPADARDAETMAEYQRAIHELSRRRQLSMA
jgi:hypothetical protein